MPAPIDFYFDFGSPYAYFASARVDAIAARHGRRVAWRPILLGAVFKITGVRPNALQPLRGDYFRRDIQRCARLYGVPFRMPAAMPIAALAASRAFWWLDGRDPELAKAFARAVFAAHWGQGVDVTPVETVAAIAAPLGVAPDELTAAVQDPAIKDVLRRETDGAIARGVFGAPFVFVDGEGFWGADRLDQVERWLETGGW